MRLLVLTALALVVFGAYLLLDSARDLAGDVGSLSSGHVATAGAPRVLNAASVPLIDGVAGFRVKCEAEGGCSGTVSIELENQPGGSGSASYALEADVDRWVGVPLPPQTRAKRGTITWRDASGATATADFTLKRP